MKAEAFLKTAVEMYRDEVSGGGVEVKVPEIGLEFFVFPAQPEETQYIYNEIGKDPTDKIFAIKLICARAKKPDGVSVFDSMDERKKAEKMLREKCPSAFTDEVARRVINEIYDAYPITSIEEAGND